MPETVEVTFQAQEWEDDMPRRADRKPNRATFTIPFEDAIVSDAEGMPSDVDDAVEILPDDDSYESDELATHENAPDWVQEWVNEAKGPFYVQTEIIE